MPHLTLEYSTNILEKDQFHDLFTKCHQLLVTLLPTELENCKSRAIEYQQYYLGNGSPENAFIHINLKILPGRSEQILRNTGEKLMEVLKGHFSNSLEKLKLQISIEIQPLEPFYFK